ncbi:hypothetical protein CBL_06508 [Carabus blaptoides fortunei]
MHHCHGPEAASIRVTVPTAAAGVVLSRFVISHGGHGVILCLQPDRTGPESITYTPQVHNYVRDCVFPSRLHDPASDDNGKWVISDKNNALIVITSRVTPSYQCRLYWANSITESNNMPITKSRQKQYNCRYGSDSPHSSTKQLSAVRIYRLRPPHDLSDPPI